MRCSAAALALGLVACGGPSRSARGPDVSRVPTPTVKVGECAEPERDGAVSAAPDRLRDRRDLDGDGVDETLVADRRLCQGDNCYWNVFVRPATDECARFAGTLAAARLEAASTTTHGWADVRGYWTLGDDRMLIHTYQFHRGGYLLTDALLCRRIADDRIVCAEDDRRHDDLR